MVTIYNGAIKDEVDKRDYNIEEVGMFSPVEWVKKETVRSFEQKDQAQSSSCVANATAKILAIENYLEEGRYFPLSARDIYSRRTNNSLGMNFREAMSIGKEYGITLESLMPSNGLSEALMNKVEDRTVFTEKTGEILKGGDFVSIPFNIDAIASVINQGKGVLLGFLFDYSEWDLVVPKISKDSVKSCHHGVAGIDYCLKDGKKAIVIDESWGFKHITQRYLTEEWFSNNRITAAWYFEDLSNIATPKIVLDNYQFNNNLYYGMRSDEVSELQKVLMSLGLLNIREATGYFGSMTVNAVKEYQTINNITPVSGFFGPLTRACMNK